MNLDYIDWLYGLGGGLMIGAASALYLLLNGRIAGISGIFGGLFSGGLGGDASERLLFLLGLVGAPAIYAAVSGGPAVNATGSVAILVAAGLLVGVGTRMGGGCTSGHGVCGMTRFSPRSIVGVIAFIFVGIFVVTLGRHVIGGL